MESQRLDLGTGRWIAAGGLAFIHVRAWRGWLLRITVAPLRDVNIGQATLLLVPPFGLGNGMLIVAVISGLLCLPEMLFAVFSGNLSLQEWSSAVVFLSIAAAIVLWRLRRRGRLVIYSSEDQLDIPHAIYFKNVQLQDGRVESFCDNLKALKSEAGDGKRRIRSFFLIPYWMYVPVAVALFFFLGFALYVGFQDFGFEDHAAYIAVIGPLVLLAMLFVVAPERSLIFSRALRRAHSFLLAGDADSAISIVQPILDAKPRHRFANYLMTIIRLMQCDLGLAEDIVIQQYNPRPDLPSRYHRIMDTRLWGARHDD